MDQKQRNSGPLAASVGKWQTGNSAGARAMLVTSTVLLAAQQLAGCDLEEPPAAPPELPSIIAPEVRPSGVQTVEALPEDASADVIVRTLDQVLPQLYRLPGNEFQRAYEVVDLLRDQPMAVDALVTRYQKLQQDDYESRAFAVQILGELRREDALAGLESIALSPLPERSELVEGLTARDFEEMIRIHAVNGLAFLRTDAGNEAIVQIMQNHESRSVRIAAINAYMWNHDDDPAAAKRLYGLLAEDLHPYVEMPRVHRSMDPEQFQNDLEAWRERWRSNED